MLTTHQELQLIANDAVSSVLIQHRRPEVMFFPRYWSLINAMVYLRASVTQQRVTLYSVMQ